MKQSSKQGGTTPVTVEKGDGEPVGVVGLRSGGPESEIPKPKGPCFTNPELDEMSADAYERLRKHDKGNISTPAYQGIAWFWNIDYKFALRDVTPERRVAVHSAFLEAGLKVGGSSRKHAEIVKRIIPEW